MSKKISVLLVDDSALVRQTLTDILESDRRIRVIGAARDPFAAARILRRQTPDVIVLDIEMPRMDGLTFLKKLMAQHPVPVVICSSLAQANSETALEALQAGAVDIVNKPRLGTKQFLHESRTLICDAVKGAFVACLKKKAAVARHQSRDVRHNADVILPQPSRVSAVLKTTEKVVVVGASTGGTEALRVFLSCFAEDAPGIVVVQHMPERFTTSFARRLDAECRITVKEAQNGDKVLRGHALIAPGNLHILLKRSGTRYFVEVKDGPLVSRHRPSVDVLFRSTARYAGRNALGVILTGMGDDGSRGMAEMKETGAYNIAQDEKTSVVFGMPAEAIAKGGVDAVLPLTEIAARVMKQSGMSV